MFTLTMLQGVLKISRHVETSGHVENFTTCWETMSKMSTHVKNVLKISYEKKVLIFYPEFTQFSDLIHLCEC